VAICLSCTNKSEFYQDGQTDRGVFFHEGFLPRLHRAIRKFGYLRNKGNFFWKFVPNYGLGKFCHGKSIVFSTKLVDGRACWRHLGLRRLIRSDRTHIVYYTSVHRNTLTQLLRFAVDLLYNLFLQLCSSWQDISTNFARRAVRCSIDSFLISLANFKKIEFTAHRKSYDCRDAETTTNLKTRWDCAVSTAYTV